MAAPHGISAQLGLKTESAYGTPVTVDRFLEFVTESVKSDIDRIESQGIRSGLRVGRSSRWAPGKQDPNGDLEFELANKGFGLLLRHMMGSIASAQPSAGPDPTVWEHTATPGDLTDDSFTLQIGRPDTGGTVNPFTYSGVKVKEWEIGCKVDEIGSLKLGVIAKDETTATALATAAYPSGDSLFVFTQGVLTIAGSAFDVMEATIKGNNNLKDDRYYIGAATRQNPLENDFREYTGELSTEFLSLTAYNRFVNGTEAALTLKFTGATISNAYKYALEITSNVRFDGETPNVGGPEVVDLTLPFKCLNSGAGDSSALSMVYRTTDATP